MSSHGGFERISDRRSSAAPEFSYSKEDEQTPPIGDVHVTGEAANIPFIQHIEELATAQDRVIALREEETRVASLAATEARTLKEAMLPSIANLIRADAAEVAKLLVAREATPDSQSNRSRSIVIKEGGLFRRRVTREVAIDPYSDEADSFWYITAESLPDLSASYSTDLTSGYYDTGSSYSPNRYNGGIGLDPRGKLRPWRGAPSPVGKLYRNDKVVRLRPGEVVPETTEEPPSITGQLLKYDRLILHYPIHRFSEPASDETLVPMLQIDEHQEGIEGQPAVIKWRNEFLHLVSRLTIKPTD